MEFNMKKLRFGIIGVGNMGTGHAMSMHNGLTADIELTAVCDIRQDRLDRIKGLLGDSAAYFTDAQEMFRSGKVDAVLIAVPHYDHPTLAIQAFEAGLHVITEKPAGVYTKQVREMNEAAKKSGKVFGIMYNQRTNPVYQKARELIQNGELGEVKRFIWIITNWFRPQAYHDSGEWRSTWKGEGGGVLINQCPHNLDLWQWIAGVPKSIHSFCHFGKHYKIDVEDDVTAYFEYENGATGVFVTTTSEVPGTNRLEISGDRGKLVIEENRKLTFYRTVETIGEFNAKNKMPFDQPEVWKCDVLSIDKEDNQHVKILNNFADAVLRGTPLLAPGEEGINGLSISNAIHLSSWLGEAVELPPNEDLYYEKLQEKIADSKFVKNPVAEVLVNDLSKTH